MRAALGFLALLLAGLAPCAAQELTVEKLAGDYLLYGVREVGSGFRFSADGKYRFFLAAGNVDELDEGTWRIEGASVVLRTIVPSAPPSVEFVRSSREDISGVRIVFEGPDARALSIVTFQRVVADGRKIPANGVSDSVSEAKNVPLPVEQVIVSLHGVLRNYFEITHQPSDPTHNQFVFRGRLGDYGSVRFSGVRLASVGDDLLLQYPRWGQDLRYVKVKPK